MAETPQAPRSTTDAQPLRLVYALALVALLLGVIEWRGGPPTPAPADAPPDTFSAARATADLHELISDLPPHPVGSEANARVRDRLAHRMRDLGLEPQAFTARVCRESRTYSSVGCSETRNLIGHLPGREEGKSVLLMAHHDSVGAGPGAADDGAGIAAILEAVRALRADIEAGQTLRNPVVVLFTDAEEDGLYGAESFTTWHPWSRDVGVVLNLEARGTEGRSVLFETSEQNGGLIDAYRAADVPDPSGSSLFYEVYRLLPNDTDLTVFKERGFPGMNFAFAEGVARYHTPRDDLAHLDHGSVQHHGDTLLAVVRELADRDLAALKAPNKVYGDLLGFTFLAWPAAWAIPLAAIALVFLLLAAGLLVRGGKSGVGGLLWGLLAWLLGLALAVGLGMLCVLLTKMLSGADLPWRAHPLPLRAAVWLAAFLGPGILARLLARRAGFWGLAFGAWLPFALLGLAAAVALPGATFQFLPATLLAGALLLAAAVAKHQPDEMRDTLLIIAGLAGGLFWLQVARNLEMAMGFQIPALILVPVALTASFFSPFFAVRPENRKMGSGLLLEAAAAMVVAVVIASLVVDTASEDNPQPVTFEYFAEAGANADTNTAHWLVAAAREMPASVRGAAEFERNRDLPPGLRPWPWIAPAEPVGLDAPTVDLLADVEIDGERRLTLRPHTARGGTQLRLLVPDAAKPLSVEIDDGTHPLKPERPIRGYHYITYNGPPRADWRLTLHLASTAPFELLLYEVSHGLPESGAALLEARPKSAQPRGFGDATRVLRRVEIPALGEALLTPTGDTAETAETASDTAEAG